MFHCIKFSKRSWDSLNLREEPSIKTRHCWSFKPSPWHWPWPLGVLQPILNSFDTSPKGECPLPLGGALLCATAGGCDSRASRNTPPYRRWSQSRPPGSWSRSTAPRGWPPPPPQWLCPRRTLWTWRGRKGTMTRSWYDDSSRGFHGAESKLPVYVLGRQRRLRGLHMGRLALNSAAVSCDKGHDMDRLEKGHDMDRLEKGHDMGRLQKACKWIFLFRKHVHLVLKGVPESLAETLFKSMVSVFSGNRKPIWEGASSALARPHESGFPVMEDSVFQTAV